MLIFKFLGSLIYTANNCPSCLFHRTTYRYIQAVS
jgi:hypothetical protein